MRLRFQSRDLNRKAKQRLAAVVAGLVLLIALSMVLAVVSTGTQDPALAARVRNAQTLRAAAARTAACFDQLGAELWPQATTGWAAMGPVGATQAAATPRTPRPGAFLATAPTNLRPGGPDWCASLAFRPPPFPSA